MPKCLHGWYWYVVHFLSVNIFIIIIMPIVFGALGSLSDSIFTNLSLLQVTDINAYQLQKTVLLKTAAILR